MSGGYLIASDIFCTCLARIPGPCRDEGTPEDPAARAYMERQAALAGWVKMSDYFPEWGPAKQGFYACTKCIARYVCSWIIREQEQPASTAPTKPRSMKGSASDEHADMRRAVLRLPDL